MHGHTQVRDINPMFLTPSAAYRIARKLWGEGAHREAERLLRHTVMHKSFTHVRICGPGDDHLHLKAFDLLKDLLRSRDTRLTNREADAAMAKRKQVEEAIAMKRAHLLDDVRRASAEVREVIRQHRPPPRRRRKGEEEEEKKPEICPVCMTAIDEDGGCGGGEEEEVIKKLLCGHYFHGDDCLDPYRGRCKQAQIVPTCPKCQEPLVEDDESFEPDYLHKRITLWR